MNSLTDELAKDKWERSMTFWHQPMMIMRFLTSILTPKAGWTKSYGTFRQGNS
ncbi:hypothetical protein AXF42_Ash004955 [Apostasia shenzhenica]|uniref:Uncharacterized protein n=1 Tax=Apostasia shenzhenica TaxID=1088818 RepID=A0A2I0B816_9ASPA|nr:hypothetical protein AXF42_Ash004955 [Apostasia shenzhenica]